MLEGGNAGATELASRTASNSASSGNNMKAGNKKKKASKGDKDEGFCASLCSCFSKSSSMSN